MRLLVGIVLAAVTCAAAVSMQGQTAPSWQTGTYVYDGAGNIKSIGSTEQFRYDALGRLVSGTAGGSTLTQSATYDGFGNLATLTTSGGTQLTFGVDPATNRLSRSVDPVSGAQYNAFATYDAAGRLTDTFNGSGDTFVYDEVDMVKRSTVDGVTKIHLYTVNDERIASVTVSGGSVGKSEWSLRDASGKVLRRLEKNGSAWTWKEDYIYRGNQLLAAELPAQTLHFHPDHLGTPRLITGNGGMKVAFHTYFPFGSEATNPNQDSERLKFTGHERDSEKLDYMHARYYFPKWGRFLSVDPKMSARLQHPQSWNRYTYTWNNPMKFVDPDGRDVMLVVRDSGAGATNFGHVAVRVFGKGYDRTYDFGRYGATAGFMKHSGEGILKVWSDFKAFHRTQTKKGDVKTGTWQTTAAFDNAVMGRFDEYLRGAEVRDSSKNMTVYKLTNDYSLFGLNCVTISLGALESAEKTTGQSLEGFGQIRGQGDPNDVYGKMDDIFGSESGDSMESMTDRVSRWRRLGGGLPR